MWGQGSGDDFNWTRHSGQTSSTYTGPSTGAGSTWYMYIETSNPRGSGDEAWLESDCFDFTSLINPTIDFDYHMFGSSMGSLHVDVSTNGGTSFSNDFVAPINGNQGDQWLIQPIGLGSFDGFSQFQFRIRGISGSSFTSDIALDDFRLFEETQVPAPATFALFGLGLVVLGWSRREQG